MEGRQYGIPPGYHEGQNARPQVSPSKVRSAYTTTNPTTTPPAPAPLFTGPPPPTHRQTPPAPTSPAQPSPTRQRRRSVASPSKDFYSAAAAVGGLSGLAAHAPPSYSSGQALRDIDKLYSFRAEIPSPQPKDERRPYTQAAPVFAAGAPAATIPPSRPLHRQHDSQSSIAPLMENRGSPGRTRRSPDRGIGSSPRRSPEREARRSPERDARRTPRRPAEVPPPLRSPNRSPPKRYRKNAYSLDDEVPVSPISRHSPLPIKTGPIATYPTGFEAPETPVRGSPSPLLRTDLRNEYSGSPVPGRHQSPMSQPSLYQGDGYDEFIDPRNIADDGDDGFESGPEIKRNERKNGMYVGNGVTAGGAIGATAGGIFGRVFSGGRQRSGQYDTVPDNDIGGGGGGGDAEKSEWLGEDEIRKKRFRRTLCWGIALVVIAAIIGGIAGGVVASKKSKSGSASGAKDGELFDINSSQVKALLNNTALHRVFPGMDYTPLNAQYPECLTTPPDQNDITLDVAILSQLSPSVRLYGTDCNQTEMVLEAIDRLGYTNSMTVWLGVWLSNNDTTNARQLDQMYDILSTYPQSRFSGVIVGNEVLYRKDMTQTTLGSTISAVRSNLTALSINLPVATSDLGDDWTATLAADTDIVMANVHPFFAGVTPDVAPGWTWNFWQTNDVVLATTPTTGTNSSWPRNIIAETGWPSEGGNDCGSESTACPDATSGAVASVDNMNTFMDGWVCQALANGTTYFWFEAFDEPWKVIFDTDLDKWESKWGLLDENRKVKDGLVIPDCGGKTVDAAY